MNRTTADWLVRLEPYVIEWETANTNLWHENHNFDLNEFNLYLRRYMTGTRLRIVEHSHPEEIPDPTPWDMYPSYDTSGSRQYAASLTHDIYNDVTTFGRSLSSGPLLQHRPLLHPFLERIQNKIRTMYEAITCTRRTDVVQHQQQQQRHSTHRHQPHPRLAFSRQPGHPVLINLAVQRGSNHNTMVPRRASCFLHSHSNTVHRRASCFLHSHSSMVPRLASCLSQSSRHSQQEPTDIRRLCRHHMIRGGVINIPRRTYRLRCRSTPSG